MAGRSGIRGADAPVDPLLGRRSRNSSPACSIRRARCRAVGAAITRLDAREPDFWDEEGLGVTYAANVHHPNWTRRARTCHSASTKDRDRSSSACRRAKLWTARWSRSCWVTENGPENVTDGGEHEVEEEAAMWLRDRDQRGTSCPDRRGRETMWEL